MENNCHDNKEKFNYYLYNAENKNYFALKDYSEIISYMESASKNLKNIHNIVIEDATYIMRTEFFNRVSEVGLTV